jgi:hypothetical protein
MIEKGKGTEGDLGRDNLRAQDCDDVECRLVAETLLEPVRRNKSQSTKKDEFEH